MKYFLIAGEASGDLHASGLIEALKQKDKQAAFRFAGGDLMAKASGTSPVIHYKDMAFMGVWDVLKNLRTIKRNFDQVKQSIKEFNPAAVILVDYPGFNLRMAKWAKQHGYKVFYYISPKLWAWKEGRVEIIRKYVDKMFVILPFETEFYRRHGIEAEYVGNPVKEAVEAFVPPDRENFNRKHGLSGKPLIALLPGSRKTEIKLMLPVMAELMEYYPAYEFVIAGAPSLTRGDYDGVLQNRPVKIIFDATYDILAHARAAVVTSGTATLETALFRVPQVVGYRTYPLQYWIGKHIVNIKFFSLVNLILNRPAVPELLQNAFNPDTIRKHLDAISEGEKREKMLRDYEDLNKIIGPYKASEQTAEGIINLLSKYQRYNKP
jgi:lipid-A-disaccharide synthase